MNPIAHREVGNALLYLDRLDEAVALLETAVSLGPTTPTLIQLCRRFDSHRRNGSALVHGPRSPPSTRCNPISTIG